MESSYRIKSPGFYPYFQNYLVEGEERCRKGFVALGEVTDYSERIVLPHERTLAKPKQDRLNLLRATLADTGLVFMLYSDPAGEVEKLLDQATSSAPLMSALDLNEEVNQLWRITDTTLNRQNPGDHVEQERHYCGRSSPL